MTTTPAIAAVPEITHHRARVNSLTAIETGLAGFGVERLADVTRGGAWYIGVLVAPGIPEMLLAGHEREFFGQYAFPSMTAVPGAVTDADIDDFARTYSRPDGWRGATGLYRSMLREGPELRALAESPGLAVPVLTVGAGGGSFTAATMSQAAPSGSAPSNSTGSATTSRWRPPKSWRGPSAASSTASTPARAKTPALRQLVRRVCWYLIERGDARTPREVMSDLHQQWSARLGDDHPDTLNSARNLAADLGEGHEA